MDIKHTMRKHHEKCQSDITNNRKEIWDIMENIDLMVFASTLDLWRLRIFFITSKAFYMF